MDMILTGEIMDISAKKCLIKRKNIIKEVAHRYNLDYKIIFSIFLIETRFRPSWFRFIEYIALFYGIFLNLLFKKRLLNYTIGCFQIGLENILRFDSGTKNQHKRYIENLTVIEIGCVLRSLPFKKNCEIAGWFISEISQKYRFYDDAYKIKYIALAYNGSYKYAEMLENIYQSIQY